MAMGFGAEAVPRTQQIGYYSDMYKLEFALPKFNMYKRILAKVLAEHAALRRMRRVVEHAARLQHQLQLPPQLPLLLPQRQLQLRLLRSGTTNLRRLVPLRRALSNHLPRDQRGLLPHRRT